MDFLGTFLHFGVPVAFRTVNTPEIMWILGRHPASISNIFLLVQKENSHKFRRNLLVFTLASYFGNYTSNFILSVAKVTHKHCIALLCEIYEFEIDRHLLRFNQINKNQNKISLISWDLAEILARHRVFAPLSGLVVLNLPTENLGCPLLPSPSPRLERARDT